MGVLLGLVAAISWGLGDYLIASLTRRIGTYRALCATQIGSLLSWVVLLIVLHKTTDGTLSRSSNLWGIAFLAAVCHVGALLLTYRSFEIGTLSLVSPIISSFSVVTALLALVSGEHIPGLKLLGAGLLVVGIVLATRAPGEGKSHMAGVPEAILSALGFGLMFWLFARVEGGLGYIWPLILMKVMATSSSLWIVSRQKQSTASSPEGAGTEHTETENTETEHDAFNTPLVWFLAAGVAFSDTLAWVVYTYGVRQEKYVAVVTAVASLFSVVTVLLAWAFLRERLSRNQWAGIGIIFLGILLVSLNLSLGTR